jgi:cyanophycinase-like exopeptidase
VKRSWRHRAAQTLVLSSLAAAPLVAGEGYKFYLVGNAVDVVRPTKGLLVLQGGGDDVDQNYVAMGERGGGGDFVVLRASGADEYNQYVFDLCHCDSVATLVFASRKAAFDPFVVQTVRNAEAIWIAGGDQSNYVRMWKDTPVEDAINFVAAKPAPIGGTSAGMAVLGEFSYSAMSEDSLTSANALADPYHRDVTLARGFLRLSPLQGMITDQHLHERDRIGRTVALLARLVHDGWTSEGRAIAADRETALHVDPADGSARVYATRDHETPYVYFLSTPGAPERCEKGKPLTYRDVTVYRIGRDGGSFDLAHWQGTGGIAYTLSAEEGVLTSSRGDAY